MTEHVTGILANCVDCGYDLRGQQESARCPECGRLNIPEAYRQEVHDLVDSGRWFFSSPFSLFAKRPPGWFWSLDRPGDVKRSFKRAAAYISVSTLILAASVGLADSCVVIITDTAVYSPASRFNEETRQVETIPGTAEVYEDTWKTSLHASPTHVSGSNELVPAKVAPHPDIVSSLAFEPGISHTALVCMLLLVVTLVGTWLFPAMVGLWTQVRKGLPGFARAPSTVMASSNYEACRLIYAAVIVALLMAVEKVVRRCAYPSIFISGPLAESIYAFAAIATLFAGPLAYAATGWFGALRSDFTKQIVRSRWHACRIVWMYAIGFTIALTLNALLLIMVFHLAG